MKGIFRRLRRMKRGDWLYAIDVVMTNAAIIISLMLIVFFLIDRVNKPMGFMTNEFHKRITFALAILAIWLAVNRVVHRYGRGDDSEHR